MTTQVLIPNSILSDALTETAAPAPSVQVTHQVSLDSSSQPKRELPYQKNHQVELLHLQAETEVLLQQLKALQQQKVESTC
jgi:hypothetical protein